MGGATRLSAPTVYLDTAHSQSGVAFSRNQDRTNCINYHALQRQPTTWSKILPRSSKLLRSRCSRCSRCRRWSRPHLRHRPRHSRNRPFRQFWRRLHLRFWCGVLHIRRAHGTHRADGASGIPPYRPSIRPSSRSSHAFLHRRLHHNFRYTLQSTRLLRRPRRRHRHRDHGRIRHVRLFAPVLPFATTRRLGAQEDGVFVAEAPFEPAAETGEDGCRFPFCGELGLLGDGFGGKAALVAAEEEAGEEGELGGVSGRKGKKEGGDAPCMQTRLVGRDGLGGRGRGARR